MSRRRVGFDANLGYTHADDGFQKQPAKNNQERTP